MHLQSIELDPTAFAQNIALFRSCFPPRTRSLFVVKANAYGHGLEQMIPLAIAESIDVLGVHSLPEAEACRAHWRGPLYILGYVGKDARSRVLEIDAEPTVLDFETLLGYESLASAQQTTVRVHLEIETGTHRQGIATEELPQFLETIRGSKFLTLAGLCTHFANIEDTTDSSYAKQQLTRFREATEPWMKHFPEVIRHTACTAAILTLPETAFDLVRLGIGAYGYWPSKETRVTFRERTDPAPELKPVLSWKTRIGQIHYARAGEYIGYGCTERVTSRTRIGMIPIGYSDGYDRGLSQMGHVLVRGKRARILGRICMNIFMVDLSDLDDAAVEDEVVLIGQQGEEEVRADDLANLLQTISYEVLARLSRDIPRNVRN